MVIVEIPENVMIRYNHPDITPRRYIAELVDKLDSFDPEVIALDYVFDQPAGETEDELLKDSFRNSGKVISGYRMVETIRDYSPAITDALLDFSNYSYSIGFSNIFNDENGVVRKIKLTNYNNTSFAFEVVMKYAGLKSGKINDEGRVTIDNGSLLELKKKYKIPDNVLYKSMTINYSRDIKNIYKIYDSDFVINCPPDNEFMRSELAGKIVLVGDSSYERDVHKTPLSGDQADTYGVLIQANAIKNILESDFITDAPFALNLILVLIFLVITVIASYNLKFIQSLIFFTSEFIFYVFLTYAVFVLFNINLPVIFVISAMLLSWIAVILFRVAFSEKDNLDAEFALVKNIPDRLIKQYADLHLESIFTPREADAVILVACPKNIPDLSEKNKPAKYLEFLNYYYRIIKQEIFAVDGSFNRILLNGVLAFWNTPLPDENAAEKALKAAKEILMRIDLINAKGRELISDFEGIHIDIAIHRGRVMAGYFGPDDNKDYTLSGDNLNYTFNIANSFSGDEESWILVTEEFKSSHELEMTVLEEMEEFDDRVYRIKL